MRYIGGITKRWIINIVGVVLAVLVIVSLVTYLVFRSNYYSSVRLTLESRSNELLSTFFSLYDTSTEDGFSQAGRDFIETFDDKETVGIWIINGSGKVELSSSGFAMEPDQDMPDFTQAMQSEIHRGLWTGYLASGERAMTLCIVMTRADNTLIGAVRYMISLEDIDNQMQRVVWMILGICLLVLLLVLLSGSFFVRSIVQPVQNISEAAKRIASGDLNTRIDHYDYDDELGALCETINNMARELEEADRIKNDFISTISHELRTPLTAIRGWGETLLQIGNTDEATLKRGMQVIINESSRLNGIVEELLDFSRMQSGRLKMNMERIDVLAELDEIVFAFKESAIKQGIETIYNVPHYPVPMKGDAGRIRQVFVNIMDNAIKYNQPGGKIIVLAQMLGETTLEIAISDTGKGIPADALPKVMERFYKIDTAVPGSGIGLAVVEEIIRMHQGTVEIDSILGSGTTVTITLPVEPVVLPEEKEISDEQA